MTATDPAPPRIYCIPATEAAVVAVLRRGLEIRDLAPGGHACVFEEDLSLLEPSPAPAPAWAERW